MDVSRVTACSFPLKEKDLDYTFQVISESGFDKIDLVGRMPHFSVTDPAYDMDELRRVVEKYGVRLANIGSYCGRGFSDESEGERKAAMDEMKKTLDVAKEFGAKSIRIFPGDGTLASMDKVVPYFQESAGYAE
ncbi:MAG: sugar phosphate isomerase/epimerase, partial [Candidatus Latescibacterota bacterium]